MKNQSEYFKEYWEKNRAARNEARKLKYAEDKDHREKVQRQARESWRRTNFAGGNVPDQTLVIGKDGREYSTVGRVARLVKRVPYTIRDYIRQGVIPQPLYFSERGAKLFSEDQARALEEVFESYDLGGLKNLAEVQEELKRRWVDGEEGRRKKRKRA